MRNIWVRIAWCLIGCLALSQWLAGQDFGRIGGTVSDASGALIPGASVHVTSTQTNATATFYDQRPGKVHRR